MKTTESGMLRRTLNVALTVSLLLPVFIVSPRQIFAEPVREVGAMSPIIEGIRFSIESPSGFSGPSLASLPTDTPESLKLGKYNPSLSPSDAIEPSLSPKVEETSVNREHDRKKDNKDSVNPQIKSLLPQGEKARMGRRWRERTKGIARAEERVKVALADGRHVFSEVPETNGLGDDDSVNTSDDRREIERKQREAEEAAEEARQRRINLESKRPERPTHLESAHAAPTGALVVRPPGTPTLDTYGVDLTQQARNGKIDPVYGRDEKIAELTRILMQKRKRNAVLIGEAGVGKTAVVEGFAQRIASGNVPPQLRQKRIISLDVSALVSGTKFHGMFEERVNKLLKEAQSNPNIVLFIDEMHTVMGAGKINENATNMANMLKQAMARGSIQLIGATTLDEYRHYIEKDKAFERRLQPIKIEAPTRDETVKILETIKPSFEKHHQVHYVDATLGLIVDAAMRYIPARNFPDSAIDVMDGVGSYARQAGRKEATEKDVLSVVSKMSGVPIEKLGQSEKNRLAHLEDHLRQRVQGQEEAIHTVSEAIRSVKSGFNISKGPLASFLFVGPTGVGKTELAKTLTEFIFGTERNLIRLDMSEYQEAYQQSRVIGAPPGYVGYEDAGGLTEKVRRNPYSVILLDEIDKAHPNFLNLLLQVLDEGRLTDSAGRTVDFTNAIIVITSNYLSQAFFEGHHPFGFNSSEAKPSLDDKKNAVLNGIQELLKPEFYNRIGNVVVFNPLDRTALAKILDDMIVQVSAIAKTKGIEIKISPEARQFLIAKGYDPRYGARLMRRVVDRHLSRPLAMESLKEKPSSRLRVSVDPSGKKLLFDTL
jgi:ATP-dependent Clp protease ATP-binding subunit ClpC